MWFFCKRFTALIKIFSYVLTLFSSWDLQASFDTGDFVSLDVVENSNPVFSGISDGEGDINLCLRMLSRGKAFARD